MKTKMLHLMISIYFLHLVGIYALNNRDLLPQISGQCPKPPGPMGICFEGCDPLTPGRGCPRGLLCCPTGCGSSCKKPVPVPGFEPSCKNKRCPRGEVCVMEPLQCLIAPCPVVAKCVKKPGTPVPGFEPSCKNKRCRRGEVCEMEPLQCLIAPCPVVAKCVKKPGTQGDACKGVCSSRDTCLTVKDGLNVCAPDKRGVCPVRRGILSCMGKRCNHDYECAGVTKCCSSNCGGRRCAEMRTTD